MGVFNFFRKKQVLVEEPNMEQNLVVEDTNNEKSTHGVVTITYGTGKPIPLFLISCGIS